MISPEAAEQACEEEVNPARSPESAEGIQLLIGDEISGTERMIEDGTGEKIVPTSFVTGRCRPSDMEQICSRRAFIRCHLARQRVVNRGGIASRANSL